MVDNTRHREALHRARYRPVVTRRREELLKVDRYSQVMHLVSRVVGKLKPELDALHADGRRSGRTL